MGGRRWMAGTLGIALCFGGCGPEAGSDARTGYAGSGAGPSSASQWSTLDSFRQARAVVERGLAALGGADAIARAGGLALAGEGVLDLGTLLQGNRPFEGDPHAIREVVAWLPQNDRLVHELDAPINPDARSWRRTDHRAGGTYRVDMSRGRASWGRPGDRRTTERTIPHLLLGEVLAHPAGLRHLGRVETARGERIAVSWSPPERVPVTLLFDAVEGFLREVEALADLPVRGDARVRWSLLEHDAVPGLGPYPTGYAIHVDDELLQEIRWTTRTAAPVGGVLDLPTEISLPEPVPFEDSAGGPGDDDGDVDRSQEPFDIRTLAPGVHLLVNLRTGFHMLFVEFEDHVVAVDAPSGWWELQELPPRDWAGTASPALGERYVAGIRSHVGDKPIRYVVLTHHHSDHMGGVRAFVDVGATVVAADLTRPVVERTLAGTLDLAGRADGARPLRFEAVQSTHTLRDETMEMRIIDVGSNPHAEGMLAIWLPEPEILYVSDLFEPWGAGSSPSAERLPVMRWFVEWLDGSGLAPERIYAIHRAALVSDENLAEIRRLVEEAR